MADNKNIKTITFDNDQTYNVIRGFFPENTIALKEQMVVFYLNQAQRVIGAYKVSEGGVTSTVGDLRLIFYVGLKFAATCFIIGHNHPSGNLETSLYLPVLVTTPTTIKSAHFLWWL